MADGGGRWLRGIHMTKRYTFRLNEDDTDLLHLLEGIPRSEEHTSELQSHKLISYAVFCLFFNDTATTEIYTLSLHDALPI